MGKVIVVSRRASSCPFGKSTSIQAPPSVQLDMTTDWPSERPLHTPISVSKDEEHVARVRFITSWQLAGWKWVGYLGFRCWQTLHL